MPAAGALRDFLVAEGERFLPRLEQPPTGRRAKASGKAN
jgi:hypothetical protein